MNSASGDGSRVSCGRRRPSGRISDPPTVHGLVGWALDLGRDRAGRAAGRAPAARQATAGHPAWFARRTSTARPRLCISPAEIRRDSRRAAELGCVRRPRHRTRARAAGQSADARPTAATMCQTRCRGRAAEGSPSLAEGLVPVASSPLAGRAWAPHLRGLGATPVARVSPVPYHGRQVESAGPRVGPSRMTSQPGGWRHSRSPVSASRSATRIHTGRVSRSISR